MIILKLYQPLKHISPSSYDVAEACQYSLYLNKCGEEPLVRDPATPQMEMGTCFDALIKAEVCNHLGIDDETKNLAHLTKDVQDKSILEEAQAVFDFYTYYKCLAELYDCGIVDIETREFVDLEYIAHGFPDMILKPHHKWFTNVKQNVPHDFKVSGYRTSGITSPDKGYFDYRIGSGLDFKSKGRHKDYGIPMERINRRWAKQLCMYNWMINGYTFNTRYGASIDQILLQKDGRVGIAQYRTYISPEFSDTLMSEVRKVWNNFKPDESGHIYLPDPMPAVMTCSPYNRDRECTKKCSYFKSTRSNPLVDGVRKGQ